MTNEEAIKQQKFLIDAYKELQNIGDRAIKVGRIIKSCEMSIEALSEQRAKGKWIASPLGDYVCNKCSWVVGKFERNFCCNCGADMRAKENKNV